jgi:5-enolpyruvylshikimate-3-phosphate synthase
MKSKILFSCSLLVFFLGLGLLIAAWNGNASVKAGWPMSESVVQLSGSATGWRAMAGVGSLLLAVFLFLWGLISLATRPMRRARKEPLSPPPGPEANGQAASH